MEAQKRKYDSIAYVQNQKRDALISAKARQMAIEQAGKKLKAVSDTRGEFAFHVPPAEARYTVSVKANGFESQEKIAAVAGEVRVDVFFQLKPVAK